MLETGWLGVKVKSNEWIGSECLGSAILLYLDEKGPSQYAGCWLLFCF